MINTRKQHLYKTLYLLPSLIVVVLFTGFIANTNQLFAAESDLPSPPQPQSVDIYLFHSEGCPHCRNEIAYLEETYSLDPYVKLNFYEVSKNRENAKLFGEVGNFMNVEVGFVPFTVIGSDYHVGFDEVKTPEFINTKIEEVKTRNDINKLTTEFFANQHKQTEKTGQQKVAVDYEKISEILPKTIAIPIIGNVSTSGLSLFMLTIVIAFVDGFNPCAMWVLLFLISLLLGMPDRKRMWIIGLTFLTASAVVNLLFMTAWLNFFMLIGYITWVRTIIGIVAILAAIYSFRSYITNKNGGCEVVDTKKRKATFEKLKQITLSKSLVLALVGVSMLAFAVNLVEAICSAGLPAIYTQILALNNLTTLQNLFYMLLYQLIFMLDDIIIFAVAMLTLQAVGIQSKYSQYARLIGGIIMLAIGLALIFAPQLLLFG